MWRVGGPVGGRGQRGLGCGSCCRGTHSLEVSFFMSLRVGVAPRQGGACDFSDSGRECQGVALPDVCLVV